MNDPEPKANTEVSDAENAEVPALRPFAAAAAVAFLASAFSAAVGGVSALALFVVAVVSGALCAALFHPASVLIPFALAYPLALLVTGSPISALTCLLPLPAAAFIGISALRKKNCAYATVGVTVVFTAFVAAAGLLFVYGEKGALDAGALREAVKDAYDAVSLYVVQIFEYAAQQAGTGISLTEESVSEFARSVIATSPAVFVIASEIMAFICVKLFALMCSAFGKEQILSDPKWIFDMSLISASIFVICTVGSFVLSFSAVEIVGFALGDIKLILTPGLALIGFRAIARRFRRRRGFSAVRLIITIVICIFLFQLIVSLISMLLSIFAIVGVLSVIKRKAPKMKTEE